MNLLKKVFLVFFVILFSCVFFAEDKRPIIVFYTKDKSASSNYILSCLNEKIYKKGKFRISVRDEAIFDEIFFNYSGLTDGELKDLNLLSASMIINLKKIDEIINSKYISTDNGGYTQYSASVVYDIKAIDPISGEILLSENKTSYGYSSTGKYVSYSEAKDSAKKNSYDSLTEYISEKINEFYAVKTKITGRKGNIIIIPKGKNDGVSKGMYFIFVENTEYIGNFSKSLKSGIAEVEEVNDTEALLHIINYPEFDINEKTIMEEQNNFDKKSDYILYSPYQYHKLRFGNTDFYNTGIYSEINYTKNDNIIHLIS